MNNRTIVIAVATVLGCALLGPYIGIHILTSRPELHEASKRSRDTVRSRVNPPRQQNTRTDRPSNEYTPGGRGDLSAIESLLEGSDSQPTARAE